MARPTFAGHQIARGVKSGDYFPNDARTGHTNPNHGADGGIYREGLTKQGYLVHLYGDGTRVVLNKTPGVNHWLYHAALDRVSQGNPHIKAAIMQQIAPEHSPLGGLHTILPGRPDVAATPAKTIVEHMPTIPRPSSY